MLLVASAFTGALAFRLSTPAIAFYTRDILNTSMAYISVISASFIMTRSFSAVFGGLLLEKKKSLVRFVVWNFGHDAPLLWRAGCKDFH